MAANNFVFVISQIFYFRVSRKFSRISRNVAKHEIEILATQNLNLGNILANLQKYLTFNRC